MFYEEMEERSPRCTLFPKQRKSLVYESEDPLPCSQNTASASSPAAFEPNQHLYIHFRIVLQSVYILQAGVPPRRSGFEPRSRNVGFVVDRVAVGQVFFPSTSFSPVNSHSTDCSTFIICHPGLVQQAN
jgi:hypothetical protein